MKSQTLDQALNRLDRRQKFQLLRYMHARQARDAMLQRKVEASLGLLSSAPPPVREDRTLTVADVASELQLSKARAYELVRAGDIPSVRIGERQVRVRRSALDQYLDGHSRKPRNQGLD